MSPPGLRERKNNRGATPLHTPAQIPNETHPQIPLKTHLGKLEVLYKLTISYPELTDDDLKALPPLPKLKRLGLAQTQITDESLQFIAPMRALEYLDLCSTNVRGPGFAHLTQLSHLEELHMTNSLLDDSAMPFITKNFRRLRRFDFVDTKVTEEGFLQLAELPWLVGIGAPNELGRSSEASQSRQRRRELMDKYLDLYDKAKKKARAAGEEVPADHIAPFNR